MTPDGGLIDAPSNGVWVIGNGAAAVFVPVNEISGYNNIDELWIGFAIHVHDGSFGSCPTYQSVIQTFPGVPRGDGLYPPPDSYPQTGWPVIIATHSPIPTLLQPEPSPRALSTGDGSASTDITATAESVASGTDSATTTDDGGGNGWVWPVAFLGVVAIGAGGVWVVRKQRGPSEWTFAGWAEVDDDLAA